MPGTQRRLLCIIAVALCAAVAVVAAPLAAQQPGYHVGPRDLLRIQVYEAPEFNSESRVSEDGKISLPVVGEVSVAGLTDNELAVHLRTVLEECCMQRASVTVQVLEFNSRPISVLGAVTRPGPLSFSGRWTLLEVITAAGGLSSQHGDVIHVLRRAENGLTDQISIPVDALLLQADPRYNIPIFSNDLVNVPATVEVTVFCLGEVQRPGAISFKSTDRITLLTAIARAGGLSDRASKSITIKREGGDGTLASETVVDYKRVLAGRDPDPELQAGDVIVVKESFF